MTRTHNLTRWATVIGRKAYLYQRPQGKRNKSYTSPIFIGIQWFRSKAEAMAFKLEYDR